MAHITDTRAKWLGKHQRTLQKRCLHMTNIGRSRALYPHHSWAQRMDNHTVGHHITEVSNEHGQHQDWVSCRILAIFLDQDWIWIFIFEKNWIRIRIFVWFLNEIFLRVIQDVTNDGAVVFFAMIFVFTKNQNDFLSMCCTHHIQNNSCYFIVNIFWRGESSKLILYCWYAVLLCWMAYVAAGRWRHM